MRKVLRGYAKDKDGNLILIGTMPVPHSKDKPSPSRRKDIWSGKVQQSSRRKHCVNPVVLSGVWRRLKAPCPFRSASAVHAGNATADDVGWTMICLR